MKKQSKGRTDIPIVFFDDTCSFCRGMMARFKDPLARIPVSIEDFKNGGEADEMEVLLPSGERLRGADAALYLARRMPRFAWFAWIFTIPPLLQVARLIYRRIAKKRHCMGEGACRVFED